MLEFFQTLFSRDGWQLFGRFHVLTVHLPIGLLLAAAFIELYALIRRRPCPSPAAQACLVIGSATAIVSAVMGWAHADYTPFTAQAQTLFYHRWIGIAAAVLAVIALALYQLAARPSKNDDQRSPALIRSYQFATLATAFAITVTGHFGGALTHGPDNFVIRHEASVPNEPLPATSRTLTFNDVQPIFAERCYNCHSDKTQKAGLRVDSPASLLTGGESGPAIIPGDSVNSLLLKRVQGLGDDPRMPPKGPPLTPAQIQMLQSWVQGGVK